MIWGWELDNSDLHYGVDFQRQPDEEVITLMCTCMQIIHYSVCLAFNLNAEH